MRSAVRRSMYRMFILIYIIGAPLTSEDKLLRTNFFHVFRMSFQHVWFSLPLNEKQSASAFSEYSGVSWQSWLNSVNSFTYQTFLFRNTFWRNKTFCLILLHYLGVGTKKARLFPSARGVIPTRLGRSRFRRGSLTFRGRISAPSSYFYWK